MKKITGFILNLIPRPWLIRLSYLVRPLLTFALRGSYYIDPIDGKTFRSFLPYGYKKQRDNVLSPSTLSLERHRLLWLYLQRETDFFSAPHKLLHVAPEQSFFKRFRSLPNLEYTSTDLHSPLATVKADICDLPFENDCFDVILCNHVLEHIPDDTQAMKELYRVMKPGGWGIFQIPQDIYREVTFEDDSITDKAERTRIFGQYDHVRIYGMDYFDRLEEVGFKAEGIDYTADFIPEDITRYGLAEGELIPLVRKI